MKNRNLTLLTDYYELTMMYGYFKKQMTKTRSVFDLFFRANSESNYCIAAGLEQAVQYIENLRFEKEQLDYLRSTKDFDEDFLAYLENFRFSGDIYALEEGTVVFPGEPLMIVKAPIIEAQLMESALLNIVNFQTLIATKASRVAYVAQPGQVSEFGLRRAQAPDAAVYGARAALIGGCSSTSNVLAAQMCDTFATGTHAHSWIMAFDSELEAFRAYAEIYPDSCLLLVDTYDTLRGVKNAITVFKEMREKGLKPKGIRLDSGDLAYLSKKAREMLDEAGFEDMTLCPETMGKVGQLGTLDEVLALCGVDSRITPCIDFGHLNARTLGGIRSKADYAAILDRIGEALGDARARQFHVHFSRIEYSKGGEKRHWTFAETQFGPEPQPLMELLAERGLAPVIICESAGTQAEDAQTMQRMYCG